jgi:hypothetical protein
MTSLEGKFMTDIPDALDKSRKSQVFSPEEQASPQVSSTS